MVLYTNQWSTPMVPPILVGFAQKCLLENTPISGASLAWLFFAHQILVGHIPIIPKCIEHPSTIWNFTFRSCTPGVTFGSFWVCHTFVFDIPLVSPWSPFLRWYCIICHGCLPPNLYVDISIWTFLLHILMNVMPARLIQPSLFVAHVYICVCYILVNFYRCFLTPYLCWLNTSF